MTDAQPAEQLVAVLEEIAHNTSISVPMGVWPVHHHADNVRRCIAIAAAALPIAREMAERERELVAAARRVNAQWPMISDAAQVEGNREAILAMADLDDALRAYDRARAAGVEVTGHE